MRQGVQNKLDFVIIGAAKAGTTSLYKKLSMHPEIFMTTPKEPEFFARDSIYQQGIEWYRELYSESKKGQVCGEASTLYSLTANFPDTASRIYKEQSNVKIIFVLRNPVDRAYSYYTQILKNYQNSTRDYSINRTFEECIFPEDNPQRKARSQFFAAFDSHHEDTPVTFIGGGMYMTVIKEYLKYFPRKNLLLIKFEDLVENLDGVTNEVCQFLNVDSEKLEGSKVVRENISRDYFLKLDQESYKYEKINQLKEFALIRGVSLMIPKKIRKKLIALIAKTSRKSKLVERPKKMENSSKKYLQELYLPEINELEIFWGKNLDSWK